MNIRRRARAIVLQCLYELDYTNHTFDYAFENHRQRHSLTTKGRHFAYRLGKNVADKRAALDKIVAELAPEWPIDQIATVDRNILRIAVFELIIASNTPPKVAINEAVELSKLFGSDSSPRFVNGVLGSLASRSETETTLSPEEAIEGYPNPVA